MNNVKKNRNKSAAILKGSKTDFILSQADSVYIAFVKSYLTTCQ